MTVEESLVVHQPKRILFFAEAVTLAHVARPLVLAKALDSSPYEVHFACADRYDFCFSGTNFCRWRIKSVSPHQFLQKLSTGVPLYDEKVLQQYIEEDFRIIDAVRPDFIVGDFRLSLSVSAVRSKVPYAAITNAHWSTHSGIRHFPLPEHPLARTLGVSAASWLFRLFQPAVFALHAIPLNRLRKKYGLPPLGDLRNAYTWGDYTLYADVPGLVPTTDLPSNHRYIGPIIWSPEISLPDWWDAVPTDKPCVYVTLGSSGQLDVLPVVISALSQMPVYVLLATAGRAVSGVSHGNLFAAEYLPGSLVARRSQLVVCNGGSATVYQALAEGIPVLGIASNMDQHLTMSAVSRAGAGILLRAGCTQEREVVEAVSRLLQTDGHSKAAQDLSRTCRSYDSAALFRSFVGEVLQ